MATLMSSDMVVWYSLVQMTTVVAGDAAAADGGGQTWPRHMPPLTPSSGSWPRRQAWAGRSGHRQSPCRRCRRAAQLRPA